MRSQKEIIPYVCFAASLVSRDIYAAGPAVHVDGFSPSSGAFLTRVDIRGAGLDALSEVSFNGVSGSVPFASPDRLVVLVPRAATTGPLTLSGSGLVLTAGVFTVTHPTPLIRYFTPSGPVGGSVLIATSEYPGRIRSLKFDDVEAQFGLLADIMPNEIVVVATVPVGATTGPITIESDAGTERTDEVFAVTTAARENAPSITSFSPATGGAGRDILIEGANFNQRATSVSFNGTAASFTQIGARIIARLPDQATGGPISVVTTAGSALSTESFTVDPNDKGPWPPRIVDFWPKTGSQRLEVLRTVTVAGLNFGFGVAEIQIGARGAFARAGLVSEHIIQVSTFESVESGLITVQAPGGSAISSDSYMVMDQAPNFLDWVPKGGSPGMAVRIAFQDSVRVTAVKFNGVEARFFSVVGDLRLPRGFSSGGVVAIVPTNAVTGPVTIETDKGSITPIEEFLIHKVPMAFPVSITSFSPTSGAEGHEVIINIQGGALSQIAVLQFNGVDASFGSIPGADPFIARVPPGAKSGPITVVDLFSSYAVSTNDFIVTAIDTPRVPLILGTLFAMTGRAGDEVVFLGASLTNVVSIKFNGQEAAFFHDTFWGALAAYVPANASTGPITITTQEGEATTDRAYAVLSPSLATFSPASSVVNQVVTIRGAMLADVNSVTINDSPVPFQAISPSEIQMTVPPNAKSGVVAVFGPSGGTTSGTNEFHVLPTLEGLARSSGVETVHIPIQGTGFSDVTSVAFNGSSAKFEIVNPTRIIAAVPIDAASGPVKVTTRGGSVTSAESFTVIPSFDLEVVALGPSAVTSGQELSFDFIVTNRSRMAATNVTLTVSLPSELSFKSVNPSCGAARNENGTVIAELGVLSQGAAAEVTLEATFTGRSPFFLIGTATSDGLDRFRYNNTASVYSIVEGSPSLRIRALAAGALKISWPTPFAGFFLQSRRISSDSTAWLDMLDTPESENDFQSVVLPISGPGQMFRLMKS